MDADEVLMDVEGKVNAIIDSLIELELSNFRKDKSFKVRYGPEAEKFYLTWVEGSYEYSLQLLIHKIMYHEGLYRAFLNDKQMADLAKVITEEPDCLYLPDSSNSIESDILDKVYWGCIRHTADVLIEKKFAVKTIFNDWMGDY